MKSEKKISGLIMTNNNKYTIKRCVNSFKDIVDELIIVDDYSTDETLKIVKNIYPKVKIYKRKMAGDYASQRNYTLSKAKNNWVLFPDSDEEFSTELINEILKILTNPKYDAYISRRDDYFFNYWIKGTSGRPLLLKKHLTFQGLVHEDVKVRKGFLKNILYHHLYRNVETNINRINNYTSIDVEKWTNEKRNYNYLTIFLMATIMPLRIFFERFFLQKYFLRGLPGFLYSLFSSFTWIIRAFKLYERKYFIDNNKKKVVGVYGKIKK